MRRRRCMVRTARITQQHAANNHPLTCRSRSPSLSGTKLETATHTRSWASGTASVNDRLTCITGAGGNVSGGGVGRQAAAGLRWLPNSGAQRSAAQAHRLLRAHVGPAGARGQAAAVGGEGQREGDGGVGEGGELVGVVGVPAKATTGGSQQDSTRAHQLRLIRSNASAPQAGQPSCPPLPRHAGRASHSPRGGRKVGAAGALPVADVQRGGAHGGAAAPRKLRGRPHGGGG